MDKEREAFEAWAKTSRSVTFLERHPDDYWHIPEQGQYKVLNAKVAWVAWQAAKEHAKKPELPSANAENPATEPVKAFCSLNAGTASPTPITPQNPLIPPNEAQ